MHSLYRSFVVEVQFSQYSDPLVTQVLDGLLVLGELRSIYSCRQLGDIKQPEPVSPLTADLQCG